MINNNLMHINSRNIGTMDSISEYQKLYINNLIGEKLNNGFAKSHKFNFFYCKKENLEDFLSNIESNYNFHRTGIYNGYVIEDNFILDIQYFFTLDDSFAYVIYILAKSNVDCNEIVFNLISTVDEYLVNKKMLRYDVIQYRDSDSLSSFFMTDDAFKNFEPKAFPYVKDIDGYINSFLNSTASLLILQGDPGTGKTTFLKYILSLMQNKKDDELSITYSFDENIFFSNEFFKRVQLNDFDVLVLEDFNSIIHKNQESEGVNPLNKFLSVCEGVITRKKKIIITTNIDSINQLYLALIRPGRCFDVLKFRALTNQEISELSICYDKEISLTTSNITLSEFYASINDERNKNHINNKLGYK